MDYEGKPLLGRYRFRWHPYLNEARTACDRFNASLDRHNSHPMYIWPREYNNRRKRDFIVEMALSFWRKYKTMKPSDRTFYELIRAGQPCRFYLDLEFSKVLNPGVIGESHMVTLRQYIKEMFLNKLVIVLELYTLAYRNNGDLLRGTIIELDATDNVKFSRHLVVNLQSRCLFRNTDHVNEYATYLHDKLYSNNCRIIKLVAGQRRFSTLIDLSVYSNNQNFRILLSSKFKDSGNRPLQLYVPVPPMIIPQQDLTYDMFKSTLIACNGIKDWNLLGWSGKQGRNKRRRPNVSNADQPRRREQSDNEPRNIVRVPFANPNAAREQTSALEQYPKLWTYFETQILPTWPLSLGADLSPIPCVTSIRNVKYSRHSNNFVNMST